MPACEGGGIVGPDRSNELHQLITLAVSDRLVLAHEQCAEPRQPLVQVIDRPAEGETSAEREEPLLDLSLDLLPRFAAPLRPHRAEPVGRGEAVLRPEPELQFGMRRERLPLAVRLDAAGVELGDEGVEILEPQVPRRQSAGELHFGPQCGAEVGRRRERHAIRGDFGRPRRLAFERHHHVRIVLANRRRVPQPPMPEFVAHHRGDLVDFEQREEAAVEDDHRRAAVDDAVGVRRGGRAHEDLRRILDHEPFARLAHHAMDLRHQRLGHPHLARPQLMPPLRLIVLACPASRRVSMRIVEREAQTGEDLVAIDGRVDGRGDWSVDGSLEGSSDGCFARNGRVGLLQRPAVAIRCITHRSILLVLLQMDTPCTANAVQARDPRPVRSSRACSHATHEA